MINATSTEYKPVVTSFEVKDIIAGIGDWGGYARYIIVELYEGRTARVPVSGTLEFLADVWKDRSLYIGENATVEHYGVTTNGALRFPSTVGMSKRQVEVKPGSFNGADLFGQRFG